MYKDDNIINFTLIWNDAFFKASVPVTILHVMVFELEMRNPRLKLNGCVRYTIIPGEPSKARLLTALTVSV